MPGLIPEESKGHREKSVAYIPAKRMGTPEEIGRVDFFLADDENSYVTGSVLTIDGVISIVV